MRGGGRAIAGSDDARGTAVRQREGERGVLRKFGFRGGGEVPVRASEQRSEAVLASAARWFGVPRPRSQFHGRAPPAEERGEGGFFFGGGRLGPLVPNPALASLNVVYASAAAGADDPDAGDGGGGGGGGGGGIVGNDVMRQKVLQLNFYRNNV